MGVISNDISQGDFKSAYLIYGNEAYLRNYYKNALKGKLVNPGDNLNYSYFEGSGTNVTEVVELLSTMPFMAEHRVVIVENSGWFGKAGGEGDGEEGGSGGKFGLLIDTIKGLSSDTVIIFSEEKADKRSKLYKCVNQNGVCEEFSEQTEEQLARWLYNMAKAQNKNLDKGTALYLIEECGKDMMLLQNEMDKLTAWCMERDSITKEDIDEVCTHQVNNKIFDMITAIANHRQKEALRLYYDLLTLRESAFHILTLMARQYTQLLAVKDGMLRNEPVAVTASKLSVPDWVARKLADSAKRMDIKEIKANLKACAKADEDIKSGNMTDMMSVELLIVSCSGV